MPYTRHSCDRRPERASSWRSRAALACLFAAAAACAATEDARARAERQLELGNYDVAYSILSAAADQTPDDSSLQRDLRRVRILHLLKKGQELVFRDHDAEALREFERVLLIDESNAVARAWIDKAKLKLADRATAAGDEARVRGRYDQALERYQEALGYWTGHEAATAGQQAIGQIYAVRRQKGLDNYMKGMRAQSERNFDQTRYHMEIALAHDPTLPRAQERLDLARRRIAEQAMREAQIAEEQGWFATALLQYQHAKAEQPNDAAIEAAIARTRSEVEVSEMLAEGSWLASRRQFAKARELLEKAYERSTRQREPISRQLIALREVGLDAHYAEAVDLELDYRYEDALAAFKAIDKEWPEQLDVRARINGLETSLAAAKEARERGQRAEAAGDTAAAVEAYRDALLHLPKFADLEQRIAALTKANAPADQQGAPPAGSTPPATGHATDRSQG
jgi:tetratricopeptide (TPR) repeat protein